MRIKTVVDEPNTTRRATFRANALGSKAVFRMCGCTFIPAKGSLAFHNFQLAVEHQQSTNQMQCIRLSPEAQQVIFKMCAGEPDIVGGSRLGMVSASADLPKIHAGPSLGDLSFNRFEIRVALPAVVWILLAQMAEAANKLLKTVRMMERPAIDSNGESDAPPPSVL
ncbi:MAG TPA: hypothetical protein VFF39_03465 [Verrucomicrobiae bacterium]|nr:hypothetical protein [Verrucomicrobiae bacterium]